MFTRIIVRSFRTGRKVITPLARSCVGRIKELASQASKTPPETPAADIPASRQFQRRGQPAALPVSTTLQYILAERLATTEQIGWAAEQGMVPDGIPRRLLANHESELTEHRRLLAEDRHALQAGLRRLAALFPLPPAPEPQPPEPPRRRAFPPLGDLLAQRPKGRLN